MKFEFKNTFLFILILLFSFGCSSVKKSKVESQKSKAIVTETTNQKVKNLAIKTGAENYEDYLPILRNKRIGIVTNPTGIVENKKHLVDFLLVNKFD